MPTRIATVLTLLVCSVLLASGAHAQILRARALTDLERRTVIMTLRLDEDQTERLDELAVICTVERQERIDEHQRETGSAQYMRGEDFAKAIKKQYAVAAELASMRDGMLADLTLLIEGDASSRVERCSMRLDRLETVQGMIGSELSGFSADPVTVSLELALPLVLDDEQTLAFEQEMLRYDKAIAPRLGTFMEMQAELIDMMAKRNGISPDDQEFVEYMGELYEHVFDMRETHKARARAIAATLPPKLREDWQREWSRQAFPEIFEKHWSETAVARVLNSGALTDEEHAAITAHRDALEPRLERLREEWSRALDDAESSASMREVMTQGRPMTPRLARVEQRALDTALSTHRQLQRILAPERHGLIPEPPSDPNDDQQRATEQ